MKVLDLINQHVAIWSFLCGDHALKREIKLISPKLLKNPDFLNPLENKLRLEVFKHKRNWIYEYMGENASFSIVKIPITQLGKFQTCFSDITLKEYTREYSNAFSHNEAFNIKRDGKTNIKKEYKDVIKEHKLKRKLERESIERKIRKRDILDVSKFNENCLLLASNRCWVMKYNSNHIILDGNHRLAAYYWAKQIDESQILSKNVFCFYFVMNKQ